MQLSVAVPTLNGRERLAACLDALAARVPDAEVVVVNGPSTDGTTGMVQDRDDVDVLLELSERNVNVARNAGIQVASGDVVALLSDALRPEADWGDAIREAVGAGADAVTGPTHEELPAGTATDTEETRTVAGKSVTYFRGGNAAFTRPTLEAIDGFDEYLQTGGARDAAHRLARRGRPVEWVPGMSVNRDAETDGGSSLRTDLPRPGADSNDVDRDWGWKYRSLTYRLVKTYGARPTVVRRVVGNAVGDARDAARQVFDGETSASTWLAGGRAVSWNVGVGLKDGLAARMADRSPSRNPSGLSDRDERWVARYDWR
jgi:glycosyltransferase involved in cell wall biosynthesis